jgi:hypothetical protein
LAGNANSGNRNAVYKGPFCGAKTRAGGSCRAPAMSNGRCRVHGGAQPKGALHPNWKGKGHSRYIPQNLMGIFIGAMEDVDRLSMDQDLALLDTRMALLLQNLESGASAATWDELGKTMEAFRGAQARGKLNDMHLAMGHMQELIEKGSGETAAWTEIGDLIKTKQKIVDSEEKRQVSQGKAIPADQVMNMISVLGRIMMDEVADPAARRKVAERVVQMVGARRLPTAALPTSMLQAASEA